MDQLAINIVVLGKSGVGKSSFCNYLFDTPDTFKTGTGKPVTSWEQNFQSHSFMHQGHLLNVFDSVGLEADNYLRWSRQFDAFMATRREQPLEPQTWIHGAFYVINANSARLEPIDKKLIESLRADARLPLQVVLTNADVAGEKVAQMVQALQKEFPGLQVTPVCSVAVRRRGGGSSQAFGRDEVLSAYLEQSHAFLSKRLAAMSCVTLKRILYKMRSEVVNRLEKADISIFKLADLDLDSALEMPDPDDFMGDLRSFDDYLSSFGFPMDWDISDELGDSVTTVLEEFGEEMERRFKEMEEAFDSGSLAQKAGAAFQMAKIVLTLKSSMIGWVDEGLERAQTELNVLFRKYAGDDDFFPPHLLSPPITVKSRLFGIF